MPTPTDIELRLCPRFYDLVAARAALAETPGVVVRAIRSECVIVNLPSGTSAYSEQAWAALERCQRYARELHA